ncbi:MAG: alanine--tRNA ligase [Longimonas sp.]|uniref:alanine--tRNA ligase n=1 Tax=Longimonas sp. TaxID=2039626 RepID=UPI003974B59B
MSTPDRSASAIRQQFLDFFAEKDHAIVPSASIVPGGDSTLLFTNAGMNQFKDVFLGTGTRDYSRAADTQKCLRVSGKHNDLDEVGHDTYHHTFFEMLGNWSFGDYFKREAIRWAWELLVDEWGLEPERLYATVHEGDDALGLEADEEAATLWAEETTIPEAHILYEPSKENFWMMGDTGPCGPCSEVHVDMRTDEERAAVDGKTLVNKDHPKVIEIWNLVFMQYDAQPDGSLKLLDNQHIDTGMGFERITAVLQGKDSTYDIDLFEPLLQAVADASPRESVRGYNDIDLDDANEVEAVRIALRVIVDHIRAIAFAILDGVTPGNVGRGYVIRRILRRAVRYGYQTLGLREPFLYALLPALTEAMGDAFPGLDEKQGYLENVIRSEEESFLETLGTGLDFFQTVVPYVHQSQKDAKAALESLQGDAQAMHLLTNAYVDHDDRATIAEAFVTTAEAGALAGEVAFLLHDTYGFPIDLTQLMAREEGLTVDMDGYEQLMKRQKERARAASQFGGTGDTDGDWHTVSDGPRSEFVGYDTTHLEDAAIRAVRTVDDDDRIGAHIELSRTPFYSESGGQVGDTGTLTVGSDTVRVLDTQRIGDRIVHMVERLPESLDAPVEATVDASRRQHIKKHHTATHLLHAVLRRTLGEHVQQKGSLVAPDRLRFDFSHFEAVTDDELRAMEVQINQAVQRNIAKQEERSVPMDEALDRGATALFDEKYGDEVRVITFDPDFSMELCGGTHVDATGEIGLVRLLSEGSVASGIRRIEAVAGDAAVDYVESELETLDRARKQFQGLQRPLESEIAALKAERDALRDQVQDLQRAQLAQHLDRIIDDATEVNGITVATGSIGEADMDLLQDLGQQLRDRLGAGAVGVLGSTDPESEKVYVVASVADDLIGAHDLKAGDLVGELGRELGGGGGGRPTFASAGGRHGDKLAAVLDGVADWVRGRVG